MADKMRAGFFIGDGAGVGKGRQLAGIIFENWLAGRKKHVWISTSNDLRLDAARDLKDIGAPNISVLALSKWRLQRFGWSRRGMKAAAGG